MKKTSLPNVLYSRERMDLVIKECPANIAYDFFRFAESKWNKKQWVALQDLLQIARREQQLLELNERIGAVEQAVGVHDILLSRTTLTIKPPETAEEEKPADKKPRTFGDRDG